MAWSGEGRDWAAADSAAEGGARCGRAASEALKVSLADIAAEPRTREAAAAEEAPRRRDEPAPRPPARPPVASRRPLRSAALLLGGRRAGAPGRTGRRGASAQRA